MFFFDWFSRRNGHGKVKEKDRKLVNGAEIIPFSTEKAVAECEIDMCDMSEEQRLDHLQGCPICRKKHLHATFEKAAKIRQKIVEATNNVDVLRERLRQSLNKQSKSM